MIYYVYYYKNFSAYFTFMYKVSTAIVKYIQYS